MLFWKSPQTLQLTEQAVSTLERDKSLPSDSVNKTYLLNVCVDEVMQSFEGVLQWGNEKAVNPTLFTMQNLTLFHYQKGIDILKLEKP